MNSQLLYCMKLKRNIFANYVSLAYITVIGIVMLPLYVKYMGAEAYGLVGFYAMLQVMFGLLDMGLTPTMARETARFRGGATDPLTYRRLVRVLEGVFLVVAVAGGGFLYLAAGYVAREWLQVTQLSVAEVQTSLELMAVIVALRWMCGLYSGAISGSERLVWLGGYTSLIATMRFIGVLLALIFIGATPRIFFSYQLVVAVLELIGLMFQAHRLLPPVNKGERLSWSWAPLKPVLKFSLAIAFTSSVWVLVRQTDKLVLSKLLPLADYGYFTLAVLAASAVMIVSGPISGAIMPRMAKLEAESDHAGLIRIYRQSTQLVALIAGAASISAAFWAEPLLWAWTGDKTIAHHAAPILTLYAIGNGILAVSAFPYYLQYAKGDLRLHLIGNAAFLVLLIPTIVWVAGRYGGVGAGYAWVAVNAIYFLTWVPLVHRKFEPGLNLRWFWQDVLIIVFVAAATGYSLSAILHPYSDSRGWQASAVIGFGVLVLMAGALASSMVREKAGAKWADCNMRWTKELLDEKERRSKRCPR